MTDQERAQQLVWLWRNCEALYPGGGWDLLSDRIAALLAGERERCAQVAAEWTQPACYYSHAEQAICVGIAAAIRAKG